MVLPVQTGLQNPILRQVSRPVGRADKKLEKLAKDMIETMEKHEGQGVGIAAPQVGINTRLIIVKIFRDRQYRQYTAQAMLNPEIIERSSATDTEEEGCLSLPGVAARVARSREVVVRFMDLRNKEHILKLSAFNARIVQHEIDHLDGILFPDRAVT